MPILKRFVASAFLVLLIPSAALAAASGYLQVEDDPAVTRGDFIRAAVLSLGLENVTVDPSLDLPFRRVSKGHEKYVRIAHQKGALEIFGFDLLLAQGITRGQAAQVLVELSGLTTATPALFKDVKVGTPLERAVRVVIGNNWLEPLRSDLFGSHRKLIGRDAKLMLRKAAGEGGTPQDSTVQRETTIKVPITGTKRLMNLPKTQLLESIWSVIEREYLRTDDIDTDEAAYKAAEGLVNSLGDKYTTFMRPVQSRQFQSQFKQETSGIGATVEFIDGILTVISPLTSSPAEAAGILPGDQIIQADGKPLAGLSFFESVELVRGPKGSKVKLTIRRGGVEHNVDVVRDTISIPDVIITWQGDVGRKVAIVQLTQFGNNALHNLRPQMEEIVAKDPIGIILDVRNNPGGLLSAAESVTSLFVPKGSVYVEVRSRKTTTQNVTTGEQVVPGSIPVVVLTNEGSASASEIVAGALQDLDRAFVIGAKTFGKGTVQSVLQFNDKSSLKITIAEWYTPNGTKIDGVGIHPDIGVSDADEQLRKALNQLETLARLR